MSSPEGWLKFASEDLRMAEIAFTEEIYNQVCFHAQQCAEKAIKALIAGDGQVPPRAHKLVTLSALTSALDFSGLMDGLNLLDLVYLPTRYPDAFPGTLEEGLPNREQSVEALATAREVFTAVSAKLKSFQG